MSRSARGGVEDLVELEQAAQGMHVCGPPMVELKLHQAAQSRHFREKQVEQPVLAKRGQGLVDPASLAENSTEDRLAGRAEGQLGRKQAGTRAD
jgi:hypothetical protein